MGRKWIFVLTVVLFLCIAPIAAAASYWDRMGSGFPNREKIYSHVYEYEHPLLTFSIRIPQLTGAAAGAWQAQFNKEIRDFAESFTEELKEIVRSSEEAGIEFRAPYQGLIDFAVKLNRGGLLSVVITAYNYTGGAHGITTRDYINLDLTTGKTIQFADLFPTESERERAAEVVNARIQEDPDWFFISRFTPDMFRSDQGFYLEQERAVICFELYEIAPYAAGIQEFAVSAP